MMGHMKTIGFVNAHFMLRHTQQVDNDNDLGLFPVCGVVLLLDMLKFLKY